MPSTSSWTTSWSSTPRCRGPDRWPPTASSPRGRARPPPVGGGGEGEPLFIDLDFFDGRKGGHMSVSGISGVATKTSFALFFLRMLTGRRDIVGDAGKNLRVLVFNVKGEDLLWLDKPNRDFSAAAAAAGG